MSTSTLNELAVFLHQAAGIIKHPSFKSLLQAPAKHSRLKTSHVSTRFQSSGKAPADWEDGSFVEFRLNPMERAA